MNVLTEDTLKTLESTIVSFEVKVDDDTYRVCMCGEGCIDCSAACENDCHEVCSDCFNNDSDSW